ncbi:MAG TPA: class I SAM-dependent methyltransferase [Candidatus Dormibacteraeota bacterium]
MPAMSDDHVARNREHWNSMAADYVETGRRNWSSEPQWGTFHIPESEAHILPDVDGLDVIELGCGTAYVGAWLARRGARVVGIDGSEAQLATARTLQAEHDLHFPLLFGNAEAVPFADASFDLAISEYGAAIWCDPYRWIPEAARLLRPGGRLIFLGNSTLLMLTVPDTDEEGAADATLKRDHFGMHRFEWPDSDGVEFHLGHGDWIRLLRGSGFDIEDLIELRPAPSATTRYPHVTVDWARRWPSEEVWVARRRP